MSLEVGPFGEKISFVKKTPRGLRSDKNSYWFVDSFFKQHPYFQQIKNITFVEAGEDQKTLNSFEKNFKTLLKNKVNRSTRIYCVGGGSIGDSIGFLCSVYMRGVKFVMLPTTWLASVDSAIGGKTALNGFGYKNIMGTFYPPEEVFFVEELVKTSSLLEAEGEIFKTLMLEHNKKWSKDILRSWSAKEISFADLENFVAYKTKIVRKDPKDLSGVRAVLNLGHSLGHAVELEKSLSHGESVKQGCLFSLRWSHNRGLLKTNVLERFEKLLNSQLSKISIPKLRKSLEQDKKGSSKGKLNFVFLGDKGPLLKEVTIDELLTEYQRQI